MDKKDKEGLMLQVYKDTMQPAAKVVGRTVQVALAPIRGLLWGAEKIEQVVNEGVERRLTKTADEKIKTPAPEIAVPILQALVYSGENENLREMYLNLLACAMDSDREKNAHRSYVSIINQLSPLDAMILAEFRPKTPQRITSSVSMKRYIVKDGKEIRVDNNDNEIDDIDDAPLPVTISEENSQLIGYSFPKIDRPIVSYYILDKPTNSATFLQENVLESKATVDITSISASVTNIARLGLIELDYVATVKEINGNTNVYGRFLEKPLLPDWELSLIHPLWRNMQVQGQPLDHSASSQNKSLELKKGVARLTQFGFNFISACVIEAEFVTE